MKPFELLGHALSPGGAALQLMRRDDEYIILADGAILMSSRMHGSEEVLAAVGCRLARLMKQPRVLIGGLGMGFTLRATLDLLPPNSSVIVSEWVPEIVTWNRGPLAEVAGHPLQDRRVIVETTDVAAILRSSISKFDVVLLDVDNGPTAFTSPSNASLYNERGIAMIRNALRLNGIMAVWSAQDDRRFEKRLRQGKLEVEVQHARGRLKKGGPRHTIFVAHKTTK